MDKYELTIVLQGNATTAKIKDVVERISTMVKANKGVVLEHEDWGKKDLAYQIEKNDTGVFLHFVLELPREAVKTISDKVRLENDIMRHLLVTKEE